MQTTLGTFSVFIFLIYTQKQLTQNVKFSCVAEIHNDPPSSLSQTILVVICTLKHHFFLFRQALKVVGDRILSQHCYKTFNEAPTV